jgi:integrase
MRAAEVCGQLRDDVTRQPTGLVLRVSQPKGFARGAPQRAIGLDKKASEAVEDWLAADHPVEDAELTPIRTAWVTLRSFQTCQGCGSELAHNEQARLRVYRTGGEFTQDHSCARCAAGQVPWGSQKALHRDVYLLRTSEGRPLDPSHLRRWLPMLARRAGLARRVHPHCLRATFARQLYDEGVGIREIQLALGHRRLDTTAVYLQSVGASEVVAATQEREW